MADNPMREIRVEKVTLNIGAGEAGQKLENAKTLLNRITGRKPITTFAKVRNPTWRIKKGDPIGAKVTVRGKEGEELLRKALEAVDKKIKRSSFDGHGNVSFGIREYIDFPGAKYDPKIGVFGFDVCVTLSRKGKRTIERRRLRARKLGARQHISRDEAMAFMSERFGVELVE